MHTSQGHAVFLKLCVVPWFTHKFNFIYTHKKSVAFLAPILTKFTIADPRYLDILCTKFHPNWTRNMEIMDGN